MSLLAGLMVACQNEDDTASGAENVVDEEIVALIEGALLAESEGVTNEALDATLTAEQYLEKTVNTEFCNITFDSTVVRSFGTNRITSSYTSEWTWTVFCNGFNLPVSLDWGRATAGTYETQRLSSDDSSSSAWTIDNLILGNNFVLNGTYQREGMQASKVRNQTAFSSTIEMTVIGLEVSKNTQRIETGIATWMVSGELTTGESFSSQGGVEFLGNGQAEITINGITYPIDIN